MSVGKGLVIGYFAQQEMDLLNEDDTPLQMMTRLSRTLGAEAREQDLRNFLGQFSFSGEMVHQRVGTLSGGERARLVLATIVYQRPNLLLLDEPTNHLDLTTREALSMALNEFEGSVMLVSHDRALLREVCDEFWLVVDGGVEELDADLDEYQRWLLEVSRARARGGEPPARPGRAPRRRRAAPAPPRAAAAPAPPAAPAAGQAPRRTQAAGAVTRAARQPHAAAAHGDPADRRPARKAGRREGRDRGRAGRRASLAGHEIADAGRRLNHIAAETAMLEERWLELHAEIESMSSTGD